MFLKCFLHIYVSEWKDKSISRCSNKSVKDTRAFALLDESLGDDNSEGCSHIQDNNIVLELHVLGDCSNATNNVELDELIGRVIHETNNECLCGLTMLHVVSKLHRYLLRKKLFISKRIRKKTLIPCKLKK